MDTHFLDEEMKPKFQKTIRGKVSMVEEHFVHTYALEAGGNTWVQLKKEPWTKDLDEEIDSSMHNDKDGWAIRSLRKPETIALF